ncbi:MAG TPA: protein phosphatase 2C domain-containing protein, partial [Ktedonobacteraceae bacterium]|nr:protein phosphatase 2C domain-containing protein [Ktedonobacteraceae bacterium]
DCGASLLDIPYILHEYSAEQSKEDTPVLQGTIVNTFVDGERTYVVEQKEVEQNAFPNGVHLLTASASDAGNVRRSDPNEDSALVLQLQRIHESFATPVGVYIVADGMGGHDNGQLASRMAINVIAEKMTRELLLAPLTGEKEGEAAQEFDEDSMVTLLHDAIEEANAALCEVNTRNKTDMGSTLTGFMIVGQHAFIVNVGDSRTYMVRGGQIYQLTTDHSLVGQLVASGLIEPDDVYTHPQRSQIYRSLGDKPNTQIDIFKQQLHPGDKLLSCCDGLWEMIRNPQIESILNTAPDPQTASQQLIDLANTNGGEDNITAVIVYVQ